MRYSIESFNLFCLPFAGGSATVFKKYQRYFSNKIAIIPIDLPGHGLYFRDPLLYNLDDMVDWIYRQIADRLSSPFAIYGHSMGGHLGHGLIHRIVREHKQLPQHLFISGNGSPSVPVKQMNYHLLPDDEFVNKLITMGGMPDLLLKEEELLELFLPILRADFQALSEYKYKPAQPFSTPVTVFYSLDDSYSFNEISNWKLETSSKIDFIEFSGNHFFIFDHFEEIGEIISDRIVNSKS